MEKLLSSIKVGKRHRKDMGDIEGLAQSIEELGLLHPIVIRPDGRLIAGDRRIRAFKQLGRKKIPVTIVDIDKIARGESAENFQRKDFTWTEAVAIQRELEPEEKAAAEERKAEGRKRGGHTSKRGQKLPGKLPASNRDDRARDRVAKAIGKKARSLDKARQIVEAAELEPEKFGKLVSQMDSSGNVNGPFKQLKVMRQAAAIRAEPPPLPMRGPYRVMSIDPPWPYEVRQEDPSHRATHPYPTMSIDAICKVDVPSIAHEDCIIFLWTTNHHMRFAYQVLDAWGFTEKTILTWGKDRFGTGDWLRGQTEHAILAVRGKPTVHLTNQSTLFFGPLRANSQKPEEFYQLVETLCPSPLYAELFSRQARPRWDGHGDEAGKPGIELPAEAEAAE